MIHVMRTAFGEMSIKSTFPLAHVEKIRNNRHMATFSHARPFNELPFLPPQAEIETKPILKRCIEARSALAELKQAGHLLPNQAVLINTLPILEAQASSEIENIVTTTDRLFQFAQFPDLFTDGPTREGFQYRTALF